MMNSTNLIHDIVDEFGHDDKPRLMRLLKALKSQLKAEQKKEVNRIVRQFNNI
jgi:hypothetical protein